MADNGAKRQEILQLLATGKITVDEAAAMLSEANEPEQWADEEAFGEIPIEKDPSTMADIDDLIKVAPDPALDYMAEKPSSQSSWLRVRVSDMKTGKNKVTVNLPMRLVRFGFAVGRRFTPELEKLDWDDIDGLLNSEKGLLVDVRDEEDGEHVQIYVD